jgi:hypothetical protein
MSAIFAALSQINDMNDARGPLRPSPFGVFLGENMKKSGRNAFFCAPRDEFPVFLRRKRLEISRFQKNFTNLQNIR